MFKTATALMATLGAASASEFVMQDGTSATMVLGVGVSSDVYTVAAAAQNGKGAEVESFNGEKWTKEFLPVGTLMDAAASEQVSVGVSMWQVVVSADHGVTYSVLDNIYGLSQSCSVFGEGSDIGMVGSWATSKGNPVVSGVAHSADAGATWTTSAIPVGSVRYGSFPTSDTWYVSSGMWGDSVSANQGSMRLSSRVDVAENGKATVREVSNMKVGANTTEASGWWGAISKTTDGGATWNVVFNSQPEDVYYFNGISCSSDTHCVAVAEGDVYVAYVTFDGGSTWTQALHDAPDNMVSLMGAGWQDDSTGWIAGTSKDGRSLTGLFFKTTDGGNSYTLDQSLTNCFPIDLDFKGSVGAAACLDSSGSSGYVAMYL